jgi:hypothetical protein
MAGAHAPRTGRESLHLFSGDIIVQYLVNKIILRHLHHHALLLIVLVVVENWMLARPSSCPSNRIR